MDRNDLCSCGSGKKYKKCCLLLNLDKENEIYLEVQYHKKCKREAWANYDVMLPKVLEKVNKDSLPVVYYFRELVEVKKIISIVEWYVLEFYVEGLKKEYKKDSISKFALMSSIFNNMYSPIYETNHSPYHK